MNPDRSYQVQVERLEMPVPGELTRELAPLWTEIFEDDFSWLEPVLAGREMAENDSFLYLARKEGRVVSTSRLTHSRADPRLGCLGEVATAPGHRGQGLAQRLCRQAAEEFDQRQGQALFLGTGNPLAARIYARLGWRFLAGSNVMLRTGPKVSPEEFLVDYFRTGGDLPVEVRPGGPRDRVPLIPLILTPHDWRVLDANARIGSLRYYHQGSCEGLHPRYAALENEGAWFTAVRADGAAVGLASAMPQAEGAWCVEAFAHRRYEETWLGPLYDRATAWAREQGATAIHTTCARSDVLKPPLLETLGFCRSERVRTLSVPGESEEVELSLWDWKGSPQLR